MNKKSMVYLYILLVVFTLFVGASTYAFFAGANNISARANLSAKAGSAYTFTSTSATDFNLDLTTSDMQQSLSGNYVSSSLGEINVSLNSPEGMRTMCTFDLLFTWNSNDKYLQSNVELPYTHTNGDTYNYEFSTIVTDKDSGEIKFNERDLSKVNNSSGFTNENGVYSGTIAENLIISADSINKSKTFVIETKIYNLPVNQPNLIGKSMKASVKVDNVNCNYLDEDDVITDELYYLSTHYFENDDGTEYNILFPLVMYGGLEISSLEEIEEIKFVNTSLTPPPTTTKVGLLKGMDGNIIKTWYIDNTVYIGGDSTVYPGPSMGNGFAFLSNTKLIDFSNANMSKVNNMMAMFGMTGANVDTLSLNFGNNFDASNVTDMTAMFMQTGSDANNFTLNLGPNFNSLKTTNMAGMFAFTGINCTNFTLDLGNNFNTANVTDMFWMFNATGAQSEKFSLNLGNHFDTSNVINMTGMFLGIGGKSNTFTLNLGNKFNTSNVTDMSDMFGGVGLMSNNFMLNLGNHFNTTKVTNMVNMFWGAAMHSNSFTLNLGSQFNTANVTNMRSMFSYMSAYSKNLVFSLGNQFNTSKVTDMSNMFAGVHGPYIELDLSSFNTANVTGFYNMFFEASFNSIVFGPGWNYSTYLSDSTMFSLYGGNIFINAPDAIRNYNWTAVNITPNFITR